MLTYQLHTRIFASEKSDTLVFPNDAQLIFKLGPGTAFGTENQPSRTLVRAHKATLTINANTGRWLAQSKPPLEPLDVTIESPNTKLVLKGDELAYNFHCENLEELEGTLTGLKWILPPLLSLVFRDPPIVLHVSGQLGTINFRWEHQPEEWRIRVRPVVSDELEEHFATAFESLSLFNGVANRRLAAALTYFHTAVRLNVCGDSPWEFMAESILNYAKCLDVLFATSDKSRDEIRRELTSLGYDEKEIEGHFVPVHVLRSYVDVAHPKVALYKADDLKTLYRYIDQVEHWFGEMLLRILTRVTAGEYTVKEVSSVELDQKDRKDMDRLLSQMKAATPSFGS